MALRCTVLALLCFVGRGEELQAACVISAGSAQENCQVEKKKLASDHLLLQVGKAVATKQEPSVNETSAAGPCFPLKTFFWNVHWECSLSANGASRACKQQIGQRFAQLATQSGAQIVASIELSNGMSQPASLVDYGLYGWTQVNGPCSRGSNGDAAALAFAPGWKVLTSGGGCLRSDYDTRAFAVANVVPPTPVQGCPSLCVVGIHAPHSSINAGKDIVQTVCGSAVNQCALAMGDWNVPAYGVSGLWSSLIGGNAPTLTLPDERTCCFPESRHYGVFDHFATNIPGAQRSDNTVFPYQLLELNPVKQHRPVSVNVNLPGAATSLTSIES